MKLNDYKNTKQFLTTLFNFFEENSIKSSIHDIKDFDTLLENILESEFLNFSFDAGSYNVDFKLKYIIDSSEVYMFAFGNDFDDKGGDLLIDLGENHLTSFLTFTFDADRHPPLLTDFIDENGKLKPEFLDGSPAEETINESEIMNLGEFSKYLAENSSHKDVKWIEVD